MKFKVRKTYKYRTCLLLFCTFWLFLFSTFVRNPSAPPKQSPSFRTNPPLPLFPQRQYLPAVQLREQILPFVDGFDNPNRLVKLVRVGPPDFFFILAPPYYGKSPMDGTRNYDLGSELRERFCPNHVDFVHEQEFDTALPLCSYGPELIYPLDDKTYVAHLMHEVCLTFNIDSKKRVQRGMIVFDPQNSHPMRCVHCPNPIEFRNWNEHACGVMWNHQANAKSLADYQACQVENQDFSTKISQRQSPSANEISGGIMYVDAVLELSFAHSNPGHQFFDSMLSLLPIIFSPHDQSFRVIVHQAPTCPDTEWLCGLLRKIGFFTQHELVIPLESSRVTCFQNLIIPKWGLSRETLIPSSFLIRLRELLFDKYDFPPPRNTLLLYAHNTMSKEVLTHRRIWLHMEHELLSHPPLLAAFPTIQVVQDFAQLSVDKQGQAFFDAQVIVMAHGGQFGNAIFAREGTVVVEIGCAGYSHLGMTSTGHHLFGTIPKALGLIHIVLVPCSCSSRDGDADFSFGPASLMRLLDVTRLYPAGSHEVRNPGRHCFE